MAARGSPGLRGSAAQAKESCWLHVAASPLPFPSRPCPCPKSLSPSNPPPSQGRNTAQREASKGFCLQTTPEVLHSWPFSWPEAVQGLEAKYAVIFLGVIFLAGRHPRDVVQCHTMQCHLLGQQSGKWVSQGGRADMVYLAGLHCK